MPTLTCLILRLDHYGRDEARALAVNFGPQALRSHRSRCLGFPFELGSLLAAYRQ